METKLRLLLYNLKANTKEFKYLIDANMRRLYLSIKYRSTFINIYWVTNTGTKKKNIDINDRFVNI